MPERVSPHAGMSDETLEHHIKRYEFALPYVAGKQVLSVACGNGYGEAMFAKAGAAQVYGFDVSQEAIAFAQANYQAANLKFAVGDATKLPLPDSAVDVVVSFETIEHIENDKAYLKEIRRILKPGGVALISTPNRAKSLRNYFAKRPPNPYHVREYLKDELAALLETYFDSVTFYGQKTIFKRRLATLPKYLWTKWRGQLPQIEKRDYEVVPYPKEANRETAIFVTVCK